MDAAALHQLESRQEPTAIRRCTIAQASLTPEEYELHLKDLHARLEAHLAGAGEDAERLLKDAERVLELADSFPDVFERYRTVEGLVADTLAHRRQEQFLAQQRGPDERPGCLLGWLLRPRRDRP